MVAADSIFGMCYISGTTINYGTIELKSGELIDDLE